MHIYSKLFCWLVSCFLSVFLLSCGHFDSGRPVKQEAQPESKQSLDTARLDSESNKPDPDRQSDQIKPVSKEVTSVQPAEEPLEEKALAEEETQEMTLDETLDSAEKSNDNQALLDSALDYYQASNDYWEQGDLENAIGALDKAYSLILVVDENEGPEILQQKEDLRITISKRIIEVYASRYTAVNGVHKAIPLVMNGHVENALNLLKGREKKFFLAAYKRSGKYRPAIIEALKEEGLPEELSWLPLIESGFNVRALSTARALGLWQFIASTGYKFGLKRDAWIDERMDPEKSTRAAIAYLKELHNIFGDWSTVLAGYNCGELRVLRNIKKQRADYLDNFWDLYETLPRETAFYVPKFLAVLHILNDPEAHGFELPPVDQPVDMESVEISKQVHLKTIAEQLNIDYSLLKEINAELRQYLTPNETYTLKVPQGKGEILLAKLDKMPVWAPPVPVYVVHHVRNGESLSGIADKYKTSVKAVMAMNGLKNSNYIKVGWQLKIPTGRKFIPPESVTPVSRPSSDQVVRYVVKTGDSLFQIANRYQTTTKALMAHNQLKDSKLQVGQVLLINPVISAHSPDQTMKYRVKKGDSPYQIARQHRMNLADFLKLNDLTPRSTIFPGQIVSVSEK